MAKKFQGKIPFWLIGLISFVVPALVAFLFLFKQKIDLGDFVYNLPHFHGAINTLTSLVLIAALIMIKKGKMQWHRMLMTSAVCMGALFLISYVTYHVSADSAIYGDVNMDGQLSDLEKENAPLRSAYLILLLVHIVASIVTLPLVLIAFAHALMANFDKHKTIVKYAYPLWLFVSVTGVTVYFLMRPYYYF